MNKKVLIALIFIMICCVMLAGCGANNQVGGDNGQQGNGTNGDLTNTKNLNCYTDYNFIEDNGLTIKLESVNESDGHITFDIVFLNSDSKLLTYDLSKTMIYRERDKAEYPIVKDPDNKFNYKEVNIPCDIATKVKFDVRIPSSINEEKFYIKLLNGKYTIYLYKMPDKYREPVTVHRYVDGTRQEDITILSYLPVLECQWRSSDGVYICNNWYTDAQMTNALKDTYTISKEITLYGKQDTVLAYEYEFTNIRRVEGIKNMPLDGVIIIPSRYKEYKILSIDQSVLCNDTLKAVYIPMSINFVGANNFVGKGVIDIYYEGTIEMWNEINRSELGNNVRIHYEQQISVMNQYK